MTRSQDSIIHPGVIQDIDNRKIYVKIMSQSACASCHAKGACSVADIEEKIIDVTNNHSKQYKVGDVVNLSMERSLGIKAVLLGYLVPFIVLVLTLIVMLSVTNNELLSGLLSLVVLIPYYIILYLLKDRLQKTFEFHIRE